MPKYLKLNRDRAAIESFDLGRITASMWMESGSPIISTLLREKHEDVRYLDCVYSVQIKEPVIEQTYTDFKQNYGERAIPVSYADNVVPLVASGLKPIMVTSQYKKVLTQSKEYEEDLKKIEKPQTMEEKILEWLRTYKDGVDVDAADELLDILGYSREDLEVEEDEVETD
jgi:hypothetical protein